MSARKTYKKPRPRRFARWSLVLTLIAAFGLVGPGVLAPSPASAGDKGYCQKVRCVSYLEMKRIVRRSLAPEWRVLDLRKVPGKNLWAARVKGPRGTDTLYWRLDGARAR